MGLYASNGMLCTQCEAEGFRRITFFPDRPDVLSTYLVQMEGGQGRLPGAAVQRQLGRPGRRRRRHALGGVGRSLPQAVLSVRAGCGRRSPPTAAASYDASGRKVDCNIWVRPGDEEPHAARDRFPAAAMAWDEQTYGREYDLDLFNIVAVADFNIGAMENKGLNIFNSRYVLADQDTATDADYDAIEGVIAHEYFHNWSGNRVTCRDWFQLSLKEGFTVLRDQLFSADIGSEPVKRIEDVRVLRAGAVPGGFRPAGPSGPARRLPGNLQFLHRDRL